MGIQRVNFETSILQIGYPAVDRGNDFRDPELFEHFRVGPQILAGQFEQPRRGLQPGTPGAVLLHVHKCSGELDQTLIEIAGRPFAIVEPQFFQHIMRLVILATVEALEVPEVMRIEASAPAAFDHRGNLRAFPAHLAKVNFRTGCPKCNLLKIDIPAVVGHPLRMAKPALGRGLGALLGGAISSGKPAAPAVSVLSGPSPDGERVQHLALDRIRPSPFQPRKEFSAEALQDLAESMKAQGVIQPLIVRDRNGAFELIAGERRWRAAQLLGLKVVPAIVRDADDRTVLELALIENLQRENLNPLEEAQGYQQLIEQFELRQEDVAVKVGKSRAVVANSLRLLKLHADVQGYLRNGQLSVGHAKVILALAGTAEQKLAAERVIKDGLNVRDTEGLIARLQQGAGPAKANGAAKPLTTGSHVADLENRLRERFGTKVQLRYKQGKGSLEIRFFSDDDLERILQIVGVSAD